MRGKNKFKGSLLFMFATTGIILGVYSDINKDILLTVDGQTSKANTISATVEDFLSNNKVRLKESCIIDPPIDTKLKDNMEIKISNQFKVIICDAGVEKKYQTTGYTVERALEDCNIVLGEKDKINKKLNSKINENDIIKITRVREEDYKEIKNIPYESEVIKDKTLLIGKTKQKIKGETGELEIKYKVLYENGKIVSKDKVSEKIIKEPVKEVIKEGTLETHSI